MQGTPHYFKRKAIHQHNSIEEARGYVQIKLNPGNIAIQGIHFIRYFSSMTLFSPFL